jgi:hypothetical protein
MAGSLEYTEKSFMIIATAPCALKIPQRTPQKKVAEIAQKQPRSGITMNFHRD